MRTVNFIALAIAALTASTVATAQRPAVKKTFSKVKSVGNARYAQGTLSLRADAERGRLIGVLKARGAKRNPETLGASATVRGDVKIFGRSKNVFYAEGRAPRSLSFVLHFRILICAWNGTVGLR